MVKYRSHQTANSREFQSGCPGQWPQIEERVSDSLVLTAQEIADGFSLLTDADHLAILSANRTAFDAWATAQRQASDSDLATKRTDINDAITALRQIRDSTGTLTGANLSNAVRVLAKAMLWLLERARELFER